MEDSKEVGDVKKDIAPRLDWNSWVLDNKEKIKINTPYRVIGKKRYILLMFGAIIFLIAFFLFGILVVGKTGIFKTVVNETHLLSCPSLPSIPACPTINIPSCPQLPTINITCPTVVCGNTTNYLNVNIKNSS